MAQNEDDRDIFNFTKRARDMLQKSTDIATKLHQNEVTPMHMMLVALCGVSVDIDHLDQFSPEHPSHLWAVLKELEIEPLDIAKGIKATLLVSELPRSRPGSRLGNATEAATETAHNGLFWRRKKGAPQPKGIDTVHSDAPSVPNRELSVLSKMHED
ncbi:hypothetical protein BDR05DRAFT_1006905 [Suillus weaverae]|nr:hypothetical protein BDR05DRAFT_1006905 [Suillus weaverae]